MARGFQISGVAQAPFRSKKEPIPAPGPPKWVTPEALGVDEPPVLEQGLFMPRVGGRTFGQSDNDDHVIVTVNDGTYGVWVLTGVLCHFYGYIGGTATWATDMNNNPLYFYLPFQPFAHPNWYNYNKVGEVDGYEFDTVATGWNYGLWVQDSQDATATEPFNHALIGFQDSNGTPSNDSMSTMFSANGGAFELYFKGVYLVQPGTTSRDLIETV